MHVLELPGMKKVLDALVNGDSAAQGKNEDGDDETPEKNLVSVAKRMLWIGRFLAETDPKQQ